MLAWHCGRKQRWRLLCCQNIWSSHRVLTARSFLPLPTTEQRPLREGEWVGRQVGDCCVPTTAVLLWPLMRLCLDNPIMGLGGGIWSVGEGWRVGYNSSIYVFVGYVFESNSTFISWKKVGLYIWWLLRLRKLACGVNGCWAPSNKIYRAKLGFQCWWWCVCFFFLVKETVHREINMQKWNTVGRMLISGLGF